MISSIYIVEGINYNVKLAHKIVTEVMLLYSPFKTLDIYSRILELDCLAKTNRFGKTNMFSSEKELPVKVTDVYGV
jgi:hypothetical protein